MKWIAKGLVALVAVEHLWFLVLEMFLFTRPTGLETFQITEEFARQAAPLAANQGLYNGFLAAGLFAGLVHRDPRVGRAFQLFFLACVVVAGVFGALTINPAIVVMQGAPAAVAGVLVLLSGRTADR